MKKTFIFLSVLIAFVASCTLVWALSGQGPQKQSFSITEDLQVPKTHLSKRVHPKSESALASRVPQRASVQKNKTSLYDPEGELLAVTSTEYNSYDVASRTLVLTASAEETQYYLTQVVNGNYAWYGEEGKSYYFSGTVTSPVNVTVVPFFSHIDLNQNYVYLDLYNFYEIPAGETVNFDFDFTYDESGMPVLFGFAVMGGDNSSEVTISDLDFGTVEAIEVLDQGQTWSETNDLPGLGLNGLEGSGEKYVVRNEEENYTMGVYYLDGTAYITGINTENGWFNAPQKIQINGETVYIHNFGYGDASTMNWTGAPNISALYLQYIDNASFNLTGSAVTDIYFSDTDITATANGTGSNTYIHAPVGTVRADVTGFKRVLIGQETPEYPESTVSDYVISCYDDQSGQEFFAGIKYDYNGYSVAEIFTDLESVTLPYACIGEYDNWYEINYVGIDDTANKGSLLAHAPNLTTLRQGWNTPTMNIDWSLYPNLTNLYVSSILNSNFSAPATLNVYINNKETYSQYLNDSNWKNANLLPDGWTGGITNVTLDDGNTVLTVDYENENGQVTNISFTDPATAPAIVTIPEYVTINSTQVRLNRADFSFQDWSTCANVTTLHAEYLEEIGFLDFNSNNIRDLYVGEGWDQNYWNMSGYEMVNIHIPYSMNRDNFSEFARVFVGDETADFPQPNSYYTQWMIKGQNDGDYFGIRYNGDTYTITEIISESTELTVPSECNGPNGILPVTNLGYDYETGYTDLFSNASNLKSLTIPESVNVFSFNSNYLSVSELHMQGSAPTIYRNLWSGVTVYIQSKESYGSYTSDSRWSSRTLVPEGWDFDWLELNVAKAGEFAQTYLEHPDTGNDWAVGYYVKISGPLNAIDLGNIKNMTSLCKLDMSEAQFNQLPDNFLQNAKGLREVILPAYLEYLPNYAFSGCSALTKVVAPALHLVNTYAFNNCAALTELDLTGVEYIGNYAFQNCYMFAPVLGQSLNYMGNYAFYNTAITSLTLAEGLTSVPNDCFYGCSLLTEVNLPSTLQTIGNYAFSGCISLTSVVIPGNVQQIGNYAFSDCSALTEITLPANLSTIGNNALRNCSALQSVKSKAITPAYASSGFTYGMDMTRCTLYVAPFVIDTYRAADYWSNFYIVKPLDEPIEDITISDAVTLDLQSEDNAVLAGNPKMTLTIDNGVGQLTAVGDGTLSASLFTIIHQLAARDNSWSGYTDYRTSLINNAEHMRADIVETEFILDPDYWHFVSFPYDVKVEDIRLSQGTDCVIRQYNAANRAAGNSGTNWEDVAGDGTLLATRGYIVRAANNTTSGSGNGYAPLVIFPSRNTTNKNNIFTSEGIIIPLEEQPAEFAHNRSWNLVGNPYPCYYDMHFLEDFTAPITLWRGNSYMAYSPVDDNLILLPNEAFFVQRPLDKENITFTAEGRMHYADAQTVTGPGVKAPALAAADDSRHVFNFNVEGAGSSDRARIVMNEEASLDYELGRDASKFFSDEATGIEIYVNGTTQYSISERPLADATALLGLRVGKEGEYTISLDGRNYEGWSVLLTDNLTGTVTDLMKTSYTFTAQAGAEDSRFTVMFAPAESTGINGISASLADQQVKVINMAGIVVYQGQARGFRAPAAGAYIVVSEDGKSYKFMSK